MGSKAVSKGVTDYQKGRTHPILLDDPPLGHVA